MSRITHSQIVAFHQAFAEAHKEINGFYRFNWSEIEGQFRKGIGAPALLLESHSAELEQNQNKTTTFANRRISFLLLNFTGKADAYTKQEEVLDAMENVALDFASYLKKEHSNRESFLYGLVDLNSFTIEPITGIFDNMFGWNILYAIKNHEPMCYDESKWEWPTP